ncbi:MAG: GNAT family N-acetyltransferase [Desulfobacteraceae bacterium]|nr:GNAT family N-acetyltransferase [Desulfobacteraceae bacterium]
MTYIIEEIRPEFDDAICQTIKNVGRDYGAVGEGFGPSDSEVLNMSRHYNRTTKSLYLIARIGDRVMGGCGIASFKGSGEVCELRKLFLLPESRGMGIGKALAQRCLEFAQSQGYKQCYLDTLSNMKSAIALYEQFGFKHLDKPFDGTIHSGCDVWMLKDL